MIENLIVIKQLPQIEEHLKDLSSEIDVKVKNAKKLVCTEESVKTVKQIRANLTKDFKVLEEQRKTVKEQILAPYMQFEEVYKTYVSNKYKEADIDLKQKIDSTENELKKQKEQEIKEYFEEYKTANNIDFVDFKQANINVTLTASKKNLKEQAKTFIDEIVDDLKLIETQEGKEEILVEYKRNLNVSKSIQEVANRHKLLEEEKKRQEELKNKQLEEAQRQADMSIKKQEVATKNALDNFVIEPPKVIEQEEILTLKFKVRGTRSKLRELKRFLEDGGYDYE
ncbi:MAG: DUF1351 domain-containing protein [Clostridia bacterium]|nr:DUF1351 domain-containing protein [Clostridia bacterium]DAY69874.1 MAG TPA: Protein of unknown function (DUF1351) [Caudoviricetes sp.]